MSDALSADYEESDRKGKQQHAQSDPAYERSSRLNGFEPEKHFGKAGHAFNTVAKHYVEQSRNAYQKIGDGRRSTGDATLALRPNFEETDNTGASDVQNYGTKT